MLLSIPPKVGVGVSSACEAVIHSVREVLQQCTSRRDLVLLKVDFNKAFNMVSRSKFPGIAREKYPEFFNWVNCCYGDH